MAWESLDYIDEGGHSQIRRRDPGVVDRSLQDGVGHPRRAVDEGARRARHADAEMGGDVSGQEPGGAVRPDPARAPVDGDSDLSGPLPVLPKSPQAHCRTVAEDGSWAARKYGRRRPLVGGDWRSADRVDAAVDAMQAAAFDPPPDTDVIEAEREELRASDVPLLAGGNLGDFFVYIEVISHPPSIGPSWRPFAPRKRDKVGNMAATTTQPDLTDEQKAICEMVRQFADEQIIPGAEHYDHEDEFPEPIVEKMKELGLFGVTVEEQYGGMGLDLLTYAMIVEELSRGWISISGIVNTHFIGTYLLMKFGTDEQKQNYLPRMATGELRAAFSLSEPELGSDVAAIKTSAKKVDDEAYEINGTKMWVTNGLRAGLVFVLVRTDPNAEPKHRGLTCFIAEKEPGVAENTGPYQGFNVPPQIKKMGYKGVESTELVFDGYRTPADSILGGEEAGLNKGFAQMMDALEVGRVNVAARGVGLAQRAFELAIRYAQARKTFGKEIAEHQAIQFKLADMATQLDAARMLTLRAARMKDAGERSDLEAGMAKLFASETGRFCAEECLRIHGGYGYSKEYEIERIYRDAPLLLIGEGTSEIQRMVIGRKLLQRHKL